MKRFTNIRILKFPTLQILNPSNPQPIVVRYTLNSMFATAADFSAFHLLADIAKTEIVTSTLGGNLFGAINSFLLLYFWVFKGAQEGKLSQKISKFAIGVILCTLCNMLFAGLFHYCFGWSIWNARIIAALGTWVLGYWYNKRITFRQHISA